MDRSGGTGGGRGETKVLGRISLNVYEEIRRCRDGVPSHGKLHRGGVSICFAYTIPFSPWSTNHLSRSSLAVIGGSAYRCSATRSGGGVGVT